MITNAIILFFIMAVIAIYALIQTRKNYFLLFLLIPFFLASTIYAAYAIYVLQGTPRNGIPTGKVEMVFVQMQKPDILFLARVEEDPIPTYFRIPYNDENKKMMGQLQRQIESGQAPEGKITKKPNGSQSNSQEFQWDRIVREPLPPKTAVLELEGVDHAIIRTIQQQQTTTESHTDNSDDNELTPFFPHDGAF